MTLDKYENVFSQYKKNLIKSKCYVHQFKIMINKGAIINTELCSFITDEKLKANKPSIPRLPSRMITFVHALI